MLAPTFVAIGRVVLRAAKRNVIAREHSDRGNLLQTSESADIGLLREHLMGIAASHFVLLAMTRILITVPLNDHLQQVMK